MTIRKPIPWKSLLLTLWVTGMPLAVSSVITYYALIYETTIRQFGPGAWMAVFTVSCVTMGLALTPTTFIALASGYFLGLPALVGVVIGYTVASLIGFSLTQAVDEGQLMNSIYGWLGDERAKRLRQLLAGIADHQFGIIVMARLSPLLPFALMNVALPVAGVRLRPFLVAGTLGMLPRTAFFVWLGSEAKNLRTLMEEGGAGLAPRLLLIGLLVVSLVGFFYYGRRILGRDVQDERG
ncbi:MAG: VTT domain-containing protein [Tunicatimonas sp.]